MNPTHDSKPAPPVVRPTTAWELYNEKAKFRDKTLMKDWVSSINSLLLFAAIFAAVLTALCVESRKLLEPDPLGSIDQTLLNIAYLLQSFNNASAIRPMLTPKEPFQPPDWAVIVNAFFFTSLTTSILAAVGAVTCLQWVEEYDAGLEAASTPKDRAIRSHYRYRATENWYMRHMIAFLPILLYVAVGFFFIGLMLWFWHLHQFLSFIPLTGFLIWVTNYTITTLMAVFYPSAPYRTAVSRALFRGFFLATFYARTCIRALILVRSLLKFLRHSFNPGEQTWNESRNQFLLDRLEFSRQIKSKLLKQYPWMMPGRDVHQSMHSHVREKGRVAQDETIHISTLTWLASSIDLSEQSIPDFHIVLKELNNLPESKLSEWQDHNYDAPWSQIFNIVLKAINRANGHIITKTSSGRHLDLGPSNDVTHILARLLHRMSLHPILFERTIQDLNTGLIVAFMHRLESRPPRDETEARIRLRSITLLLSSMKWAEMNTGDWEETNASEQPVRQVFKIILDCLNMMQSDDNDPSNAASWVFTLCHKHTEDKCGTGTVLNWPKPELTRFYPDAFNNQDLREHALIHFLHFVDSILSGTTPTTNIRWRWRWNNGSKATEDDQIDILKLLVHHFLRIFFAFEQSRGWENQFNDLLISQRITSPALRLVLAAFGGHRQTEELPEVGDIIWNNAAWQYAISIWYGFQTHYNVCNGRQISISVPVDQSTQMITRLRDATPFGLELLITRATDTPPSSKPLSFWSSLAHLMLETEGKKVDGFSSLTVGLHPQPWLHIFTHFHSTETSGAPDSVTKAMLESLKVALRHHLYQLGWKAAAAHVLTLPPSASASSRSVPKGGFAKTVLEVLRREKHDQTSRLPLPYGILLLIRDIFRADPNDASSHTFKYLNACVAIADALSLSYTNGNRRDKYYALVLLEISEALKPISARLEPPRPRSRFHRTKATGSDDGHEWRDQFQTALQNTFHAGRIPLKIDGIAPDEVAKRNSAPSSPSEKKFGSKGKGKATGINIV